MSRGRQLVDMVLKPIENVQKECFTDQGNIREFIVLEDGFLQEVSDPDNTELLQGVEEQSEFSKQGKIYFLLQSLIRYNFYILVIF